MKKILCLLSVALCTIVARAESNALQDGDRIAIIGDSITEQKLYSRFIEEYLLMCKQIGRASCRERV